MFNDVRLSEIVIVILKMEVEGGDVNSDVICSFFLAGEWRWELWSGWLCKQSEVDDDDHDNGMQNKKKKKHLKIRNSMQF